MRCSPPSAPRIDRRRPCQIRLSAGHQHAVGPRRPTRREESSSTTRRTPHRRGPRPASTPFSPCTGRRWASRTRRGDHRKTSSWTSCPPSLPRVARPGRSPSPAETPAAPPKPWPPPRPDTPWRPALRRSARGSTSPTRTSAHCCCPDGSRKPRGGRARAPAGSRSPGHAAAASVPPSRVEPPLVPAASTPHVRCWNRWPSVVRRGRGHRLGVPIPAPTDDCAGHARSTAEAAAALAALEDRRIRVAVPGLRVCDRPGMGGRRPGRRQ